MKIEKQYAHSGVGFVPQPYEEHIHNVYIGAVNRAKRTLYRSSLTQTQKDFFVDCVSIASFYHDLGKLDRTSQPILSATSPNKNVRMLNHVDAGVAVCLNEFIKTKNLCYLMAAWLVSAHHIGFQNFDELVSRKNGGLFGGVIYKATEAFRDNRNLKDTYNIISENKTISEYVDKYLPEYLEKHNACVGITYTPTTNEQKQLPTTFFDMRMMLSCLVDADHTDTTIFYSPNDPVFIPNYLEPENRLTVLADHIKRLPKKGSKSRQKMRNLLSGLAFNGKIPDNTNFFCMDGPVGSGKTFAEIAYALRIAEKHCCDRINTAMPFINVNMQTTGQYRNGVLFYGEDINNVNPIHSKCEFDSFMLRKYSKTWMYPFNITTAVQYFESIVSNHPSALRKLHLFANSVNILDEFHQMTEHGYWNYNLHLLEQLSRYNTYFLLGSGTSVYYWQLFNFSKPVHQIVSGENYKKLQTAEKKRVKRITIKKPFAEILPFCKFVLKEKGQSKLVVLNTIKNALLIADVLRNTRHKYEVFHLSTCLNQRDKDIILEKIKVALNEKRRVLVVATSTIECGVDISFEVGFREKIGLLQREQFGGRIGRNEEYVNSRTYVFEFDDEIKGRDGILTENPANEAAIQVFNSLPDKQLTPEYCTEAVKLELEILDDENDFIALEKSGRLKEIAEKYKVIADQTICILTDKSIVERMKRNDYIKPNEISSTMVQVWITKMERLLEAGLITKLSNVLETPVIVAGTGDRYYNETDHDYYVWNGSYDPEFYGIGRWML